MNGYKKIFKNQRFRLNILKILRFIPDKLMLKIEYRMKFGKKLNLKNPKTFNEKIQWLKLYDRNPVYTVMADKYGAKKHVADIIGNEHVIPTFGVWNRFEDVDLSALPEQFVLKCTHDSGSIVICKDKSQFDWKQAEGVLKKGLEQNGYYCGREWCYKDIKPRIIAEQYMEDQNEAEGLTDYKFYCFNGEPKFLYVSQGLQDHATASISFLTTDWQFAPYERADFKPLSELPRKPECLSEMLEICKKLSENIPFLRVDLYEINNKIYFSELTFYPCSGFMPFKNPEHDYEIGKLLTLPENK